MTPQESIDAISKESLNALDADGLCDFARAAGHDAVRGISEHYCHYLTLAMAYTKKRHMSFEDSPCPSLAEVIEGITHRELYNLHIAAINFAQVTREATAIDCAFTLLRLVTAVIGTLYCGGEVAHEN